MTNVTLKILQIEQNIVYQNIRITPCAHLIDITIELEASPTQNRASDA